jgi:hypothetical protein
MQSRRLVSHLILTLLLLFGQGAVLAHELDQDAHKSGAVCNVCLHHHTAKDFIHTGATLYAPVLPPHAWRSAPHADAASARPAAPRARGPPRSRV